MKLSKENQKWIKTLQNDDSIRDLYCVVIPFVDKISFKQAIEPIKNMRNDNDIMKRKWWVDGLLIDKYEYVKLLKKSKSIEILNELEEKDEKFI